MLLMETPLSFIHSSTNSSPAVRPQPPPNDQPFSLEYPQRLLKHILYLQFSNRNKHKEIKRVQAEYFEGRKELATLTNTKEKQSKLQVTSQPTQSENVCF